jgi:hypothetical protein
MKTSCPENLRLVGIILSFGCSFHGTAQSPPLTATDIKNGVFVFFSYKDGSKSTYTRNGDTQKEVNPVTRENTLWDIQWIMIGNPNIDSILVTRRADFDSAISRTATLYVFRPGKFAEGGQDCILTINDTPAVIVNNKATFIIRFVKEGQTKISEKVNKQESVVMLDVKKGNKYFLRCEVLWRIPPKPILTLVSAEEGRTYFDNIK